MEMVAKESENMRRGNLDSLPEDNTANAISSYGFCYRCGYEGHSASMCGFKIAKCHVCQKVGHLARVYRSRQRIDSSKKHKSPSLSTNKAGVHQLQDKETGNDSDGNGELFNICHLNIQHTPGKENHLADCLYLLPSKMKTLTELKRCKWW